MQQLLIGVNISYVIHISIARNHFLSQNSELLRLCPVTFELAKLSEAIKADTYPLYERVLIRGRVHP